MSWFKRTKKGIQTPTELKKDVPKGLWYKSPTGKIVDTEQLGKNFYVYGTFKASDASFDRIGSISQNKALQIVTGRAMCLHFTRCSASRFELKERCH
jgi:acetyl-CoA carboxylase carboxyl transferase subunit beta